MAQAKRKKTLPAARKSSSNKSAARKSNAGWSEYSSSGFGQKWEPKKKGDTVEGIVTLRKKFPPQKKGDKPGEIVEISTHDGHSVSVSRSTALQLFFGKVRVGDTVRIIFDGLLKATKKGYSPMKLMRAFIKD